MSLDLSRERECVVFFRQVRLVSLDQKKAGVAGRTRLIKKTCSHIFLTREWVHTQLFNCLVIFFFLITLLRNHQSDSARMFKVSVQ